MKLKSCPFCGNEDVHVLVARDKNPKTLQEELHYSVGCPKCKTAIFKYRTKEEDWDCMLTEDEAIRHWNRRDEK